MAREVTLADLRTRARQLADVEGDPNITDAELTSLANRHLTEVFDRLVDAGPPEYYAASQTLTTSAGVSTYALPVTFRDLQQVFVHEDGEERRALLPMPTNARGRYKAPTGQWTLTLEYTPTAPVLVSDADTFDGVSGWDELIVNLMARDVHAKRESDPSIVMSNIARLEARITLRGRNRDRGSPKRIVDLDEVMTDQSPWGWMHTTRLACYRLRAGNIELYEPLWGLP